MTPAARRYGDVRRGRCRRLEGPASLAGVVEGGAGCVGAAGAVYTTARVGGGRSKIQRLDRRLGPAETERPPARAQGVADRSRRVGPLQAVVAEIEVLIVGDTTASG